MPFRLPNAVHETTTTSGTGPLTLLGAVANRKTFGSQLSNGDTTMIVITDGTDWECAVGTFTSPSTISRDTVIYSTNGNAWVNWPASGTRDVFIAAAGEVFAGLVDPGMANGLMCKTTDRTYAGRTLAAGHGISISNPAGTAGNPTIAQTVVPAGTVMLFMQAAAPTGWTQVVSHNNKALRIVSGAGAGSGGTTAFTSVFGAGKATDSHVLTEAEMPAHTHGVGTYQTGFGGVHAHTFPLQGGGSYPGIVPTASTFNTNQNYASPNTTHNSGSHNHTISGSSGSAGSGGGHTHTLTLDLQYVDIIACTKDI